MRGFYRIRLAAFSQDLNTPGGLPHDLVTDSVIFPSLQASIFRMEAMVDSATLVINNLKAISTDPNSPVGILLRDEQTGAQLQQVIGNLDEDLEALQHNFLLRRFFRERGGDTIGRVGSPGQESDTL